MVANGSILTSDDVRGTFFVVNVYLKYRKLSKIRILSECSILAPISNNTVRKKCVNAIFSYRLYYIICETWASIFVYYELYIQKGLKV
jgi:hypothetical protein